MSTGVEAKVRKGVISVAELPPTSQSFLDIFKSPSFRYLIAPIGVETLTPITDCRALRS